jgi:predicted lipoprotein with Yx(FWY)xxD motif
VNRLKLVVPGIILAVVLAACSATATPNTSPVSTPVPATGGQPTVMVAANPDLGSILVDSKGMTLYTYANDESNASTCSGACATTWPPLTVAAGVTPTAGPGVTGTLGVIHRDDGGWQVTLDGLPLYYYSGDAQAGSANGDGIQYLWYVVLQPGGASTAPAGLPTVMVSNSPVLGLILVDSRGMTLYTTEQDSDGITTCSGACATTWPPLTVAAGVTPTAGPGVVGMLGVIQRPDGTSQVTIDGLPLYYYSGDAIPGDVNGQGSNSVWYAAPQGTAQ